MKKLFASASYSFNNFYSNLNIKGQIVFSVIVFLIIILFIMLFIVDIIQKSNDRKRLNALKHNQKSFLNENDEIIKNDEEIIEVEKIDEIKAFENNLELDNKKEVFDIAQKIEEALKDEKVSLTNFEEDQEKTAIISIDELMKKAKELEMIEDEVSGVNYLEQYNIKEVMEEEFKESNEVKAFKVSQVISPIYGVKKDYNEENN